jgi:Xaa-Pro aminopeptidase
MDTIRGDQMREEMEKVIAVLEATPPVDPTKSISTDEFKARQHKVWEAIRQAGFDGGFLLSNEHFHGDVPYLGGNTNIQIEQVAGVIGPNGFHLIAGLEGGYAVEQLAGRAGAVVHKVEMLKLADEEFPIDAERPEEVFEIACGKIPTRIALLSPREVVPDRIIEFLKVHFGPDSIVDAQEIYGKVRYEKSDAEMELIKDASIIADAIMRAMLAVLKPGMRETQVSAWGNFVARELGAEELGFDFIVNTGSSNRSLIGKALNNTIQVGDMVQIGVSPRRDGLSSCIRRSVVMLEPGQTMPDHHRYWLDMIKDVYQVAREQFIAAARDNLPAYTIEKAIVDFLASKSDEVSNRVGRPIDLSYQKPYSSVHNSGYTECLEFYGGVTLDSQEPLGTQIVNMIDVALRGSGSKWDDMIIPDLDYVVVEDTYGKSGRHAECLNSVPVDCQHLVGRGVA